MTKIISRLAMLSSLLFIPFFSIAQNLSDEHAQERFCQYISKEYVWFGCVNKHIDSSSSDNFTSNISRATVSCQTAGNDFEPIDMQTMRSWSGSTLIHAIESYWQFKAICYGRIHEDCFSPGMTSCIGGECTTVNKPAGPRCQNSLREYHTCSEQVTYDMKEGFCG